jgi:uncharacterized phiE125 gp8 family phage protein
VAAAYSLIGTAVDVLGYPAVVELVSGTNGTGGTVDVKLQDSDDNVTFTDVTPGSFTQVTEANDNATYEKEYTGGRHYLRVVCTVGVAACDFGVNIVKKDSDTTEDTELDIIIETARQYCEDFQNRAYINQTWELWMDEWPEEDYIEIPKPPLSSITSITYYDVDDAEYTLSTDDYFVDTKNEPGFVCLNDGYSWPTTTLRPANGICVTFVAGYGAAGSNVPKKMKMAMLLLIGHLYEHREAVSDKNLVKVPFAVEALLWQDRCF